MAALDIRGGKEGFEAGGVIEGGHFLGGGEGLNMWRGNPLLGFGEINLTPARRYKTPHIANRFSTM